MSDMAQPTDSEGADEQMAEYAEAEKWATRRAAAARQQASQLARATELSRGLQGGSSATTATPKEVLTQSRKRNLAGPKQRLGSPTEKTKPHYPATTAAYAYAIQPGRADAIMAAAERSVGEVDQIDDATMLEMMSEANLSQAALESKWMKNHKLKVEFAKQEKAARRQVAPTELPVHEYLQAEVHTGEGWPEPYLDGEDHTVVHSDSAPRSKINLSLLMDGEALFAPTEPTTAAFVQQADGSSPMSARTARQLLGSSKVITPPSTMKAIAKGLSSEMWHREEEEEKQNHDLWVKQNAERMANFEAQKQDTKARIRQLEADLMGPDDDDDE